MADQTQPPPLHRSGRARARTHTHTTRDPGRASRRETSASEQEGPPPLLASKPLMILPQVHLRKPCYDFYFL